MEVKYFSIDCDFSHNGFKEALYQFWKDEKTRHLLFDESLTPIIECNIAEEYYAGKIICELSFTSKIARRTNVVVNSELAHDAWRFILGDYQIYSNGA